MLETPLATSSPIRSKIKQMSRRKAKNSRRSVSLLDVSAIDANPDVSSQISESNETLASGYRDSGYVRSEVSSLEEDDGKIPKDLVEELKFKDVLICELQESNRGLRMRCADAENKIWRLRVKCQSHCGCCQVQEVAASPTDSAGEDKDASTAKEKFESLSHDLFRFKRPQSFSTSSNDLSLTFGPDRLANSPGRLASTPRLNASLPVTSTRPLSRSRSSGTIGTQTPARQSSRRAEEPVAEKLFALKVQQWQKQSLEHSHADVNSAYQVASSTLGAVDLSPSSLHPSHQPSLLDRALEQFGAEGEESLLSVISERDSSQEVDTRKVIKEALLSPDLISTDSSITHSTPFADITNRRDSSHSGKNQVSNASNAQQHSTAPQYFHPGSDVDPHPRTPKDVHYADTDWTKKPEVVSEPPRASHGQFEAREYPYGHCCPQPSPVIIVPTGCCSCCKSADNRTTPTSPHAQPPCEVPPEKDLSSNRLKLDASTDSSDLHPIFEVKSKAPSAAGKLSFSSASGSDSKTDQGTTCRKDPASERDCTCSLNCSGLTVPLASRFDAKAEYKRMIEEGMKKIALNARAETESLSFQPWTSPGSPEMSPLMKRLAETSHYVSQMAVAINRIKSRFQDVTGTPNPVNPSP